VAQLYSFTLAPIKGSRQKLEKILRLSWSKVAAVLLVVIPTIIHECIMSGFDALKALAFGVEESEGRIDLSTISYSSVRVSSCWLRHPDQA
jgi:hypothetical protein